MSRVDWFLSSVNWLVEVSGALRVKGENVCLLELSEF